MSTTLPIEPLVSDEQIRPKPRWGTNLWSGKEEVILPRPLTPEQVRDKYEAERAELIRQRDEAVKHLRELTEHWSAEVGAIYPFAEDVENAVNFLSTLPSPPNR